MLALYFGIPTLPGAQPHSSVLWQGKLIHGDMKSKIIVYTGGNKKEKQGLHSKKIRVNASPQEKREKKKAG